MYPVVTHVSMSSWPMWTWKLSGGSPPSMRVLRTALAFEPAPPATVALTISTPGFWARYMSNNAFRPAASPPVVHHEKISRRPGGAGSMVAAAAPGTMSAAAMPAAAITLANRLIALKRILFVLPHVVTAGSIRRLAELRQAFIAEGVDKR